MGLFDYGTPSAAKALRGWLRAVRSVAYWRLVPTMNGCSWADTVELLVSRSDTHQRELLCGRTADKRPANAARRVQATCTRRLPHSADRVHQHAHRQPQRCCPMHRHGRTKVHRPSTARRPRGDLDNLNRAGRNKTGRRDTTRGYPACPSTRNLKPMTPPNLS